ncbi:MAG TPA: toll/interleukin-1 receptor domain-containing protein [Polyangiaceae bacterium]|nr:toll/interleukin-1 receptor domain-containing protein [Polyangiaceae bacterium]
MGLVLESPNIFISYAREDRHHVQRLRALLGAIVGEGAIFAEQEQVRAGTTWTLELARAIVNSTHFVVVWSSSARDSHWVNQEVTSAVELAHEQPLRRIIPVRIDRTPLPEELEAFAGIDLFGDKVGKRSPFADGVQLSVSIATVGGLALAIQRYNPVWLGLAAMWLALAAFVALRFEPRPQPTSDARGDGRRRWALGVTPRALAVLFTGGCLCALFALGRLLVGHV